MDVPALVPEPFATASNPSSSLDQPLKPKKWFISSMAFAKPSSRTAPFELQPELLVSLETWMRRPLRRSPSQLLRQRSQSASQKNCAVAYSVRLSPKCDSCTIRFSSGPPHSRKQRSSLAGSVLGEMPLSVTQNWPAAGLRSRRMRHDVDIRETRLARGLLSREFESTGRWSKRRGSKLGWWSGGGSLGPRLTHSS